MKIRNGFVSNSSSSSFVIYKRHLTEKQIEQIIHNDYSDQDYTSEWNITENNLEIKGYCFMDNYSMYEFLDKIGVDLNNVKWSD